MNQKGVQGVLVARGASSYDEQMALVDGFTVAFPEDLDEELLEPKVAVSSRFGRARIESSRRGRGEHALSH